MEQKKNNDFNKFPKNLKMDYTNIPTIIFSHPPTAYIGLNIEEAKKQYGEDNINIFKTTWHGVTWIM